MELNSPGKRIKFIRIEGLGEKFSQVEFADSLFITQGMLSRIESDESEPTEQTAFIIQAKYDYNMLWVLKGTGPLKIDSNSSFTTKEIETYDKIIRSISKHPESKKWVEQYLKLNEGDRVAINLITKQLLEKYN